MRAVVQRVREARVEVDSLVVGRIGHGLLAYVGAGKGDTDAVASWLASKIAGLRMFNDNAGKMARSVADVEGAILVVPQFTLYGDVRRGRRPRFDGAAPPDLALGLIEQVCAVLRAEGLKVETGRFRSTMAVHAEVDGPVTILVDSEGTF